MPGVATSPLFLAKQGEGDEISIDKLHGNGMALGMVPSEFFDETIEDKVVPFEKGNEWFCLPME